MEIISVMLLNQWAIFIIFIYIYIHAVNLFAREELAVQ
jgi:hypothetical protein